MTEWTVGRLRQAAERVRASVELDQAYVVSVAFTSVEDHASPPFEVTTGLSVGGVVTDDDVEVRSTYTVEAVTADDRAEQAWNAAVTCAARFTALSRDLAALAEEDVHAFAFFVGAPILHPYAREVVQSLTARSPYPAFTLGLLTPPELRPDDEVLSLKGSEGEPKPEPTDPAG